MKIVYCVYELGVGGGIERVLTSKVNYLVSQGHQVSILTCDYDGRPTAYGIDPRIPITNFDIDYASDYQVPLHKRITNTLSKMRVHKRKMTEYLMRERPDIVVATQIVETSFLPSIKDGSKKVLELHGSQLMYRQEKNPKPYSLRSLLVRIYELRDRFYLSRFDAVGCLTHEDCELRGKPSNMHVIPNPLPFVATAQAQLEDKVVLAVGRMTSQKDFSSLINIWASIAGKYPEWRLRIVGEGYLYSALKALVERLGLGASVELLPADLNIQPYYLGASMFAMTSTFEGMPMTLLEAQSMGLPIISYTCPCGPSDIVEEGKTGYLVSPGDKALFAERLSQLIENEELRRSMGTEAQKAAQRYRLELVMESWVALFKQLISNK
ncbi:MAG: glycosyltransferase family 4 protein [Porphyromonas sp.]|nr:glycosyltransferase family 4 protein [Porphyromonas sp.]